MKIDFESFLQKKFMKNYMGTDDDAQDAFLAWLENQQVETIIDYADLFADELLKQEHI